MERVISEVQFEEEFQPVANVLNPDASWGGWLFEPAGKELAMVNTIFRAAPGKVWTVLECDGKLLLASGMHVVNRMGYIITSVAVPAHQSITVIDEDAPGEDAPDLQFDDEAEPEEEE